MPGPRDDEVEVSLLGPGYGESVLVHTGEGEWLVVDSCLDSDGEPTALNYLRGMDVDPSTAVKMVVSTHWHDDHIRGMARLISACSSARFCCASALKTDEFLGVAGGLTTKDYSEFGSGLREIQAVFTSLRREGRRPVWATANRRLVRRNGCDVWSLSPDDDAFESFVRSVAALVLQSRERQGARHRTRRNDVSVALWIRCGDAVCLLGADVQKRGWTAILRNTQRPRRKASVFKVPHHGSSSAHLPEAWNELLAPEPVAILTPWRRGAGVLPGKDDVRRILSRTPCAYASAASAAGAVRRRGMVAKTVREAKARMRIEWEPLGMVRLRRSLAKDRSWSVNLFGSACHLRDYSA